MEQHQQQQPGTPTSPVRKNPSGKHVRCGQRIILNNLYKQMMKKDPSTKQPEIITTLSKQTGIGLSTVRNTIVEYKNTGNVTSPNKKRRKLSAIQKLCEEEKYRIRHKVHEFWFRREIPNLNKILLAVNTDPALGMYKRSTLHKVLQDLEFSFSKRHRNSGLIEKEYIVLWRQTYLRKIAQYRAEGRHIYYLDETWVNAGDSQNKNWIDKTVRSSRDAQERGLSAGIPAPTGKDKRLIVVHIGSVDGFVLGGLLCFQSRKNTADYHDEMKGDTFLEWFGGILPSLKESSVIVMDNASYHSVKAERCPTMNWTKPRIIDWLISKQQAIPPFAGKVTLIDMVKQIKPQFGKYVIDELAKANGKIVPRLPPYHCELNPIELVWAIVKRYVKVTITTYRFDRVQELLVEGVERVSVQNWQNFMRHTESEERKFIELDEIIDELQDADILGNPIPQGDCGGSEADSGEEL